MVLKLKKLIVMGSHLKTFFFFKNIMLSTIT